MKSRNKIEYCSNDSRLHLPGTWPTASHKKYLLIASAMASLLAMYMESLLITNITRSQKKAKTMTTFSSAWYFLCCGEEDAEKFKCYHCWQTIASCSRDDDMHVPYLMNDPANYGKHAKSNHLDSACRQYTVVIANGLINTMVWWIWENFKVSLHSDCSTNCQNG